MREIVRNRNIEAELLSFHTSCHSVAEAAVAAGVSPADFIKSICMISRDGRTVVAVVKGEDRADRRLVAEVLGTRPLRLASPDEILTRTGFPCGGTPPFGYEASFAVDENVLRMAEVYGGGGSVTSLVRISPAEILRVTGGAIGKIRA